MSTIGVVLLVAFIIVCVLLILLVIIQDDGESGMGGLLGGRGTAAFGSHSASVLTKTTTAFVVLFFALVLGLALLNKKPKLDDDLVAPEQAVEASADETASTEKNWYEDDEVAAETTETSEVTE